MKHFHLPSTFLLALLLAGCGDKNASSDGHGSEAAGEHEEGEQPTKGMHGGRLLEQDGYAVELAIAEDGTPPRYQAWLYHGKKMLPATAGSIEVRLKRLGDRAETHRLAPQSDGSLMAATVVGEPHSFDVEVLAKVAGKSLRWAYPSYEGRTVIQTKVATDAGIRVAPAAPGVIADEHEVQGLLTPVEGRIAKLMARFPGPIRSLRANVGDRVRAARRWRPSKAT